MTETSVDTLRRRAEAALERDERGNDAEKLLERLARLANEESEHAVFAHRHLAELLLERHPWRAALHLRKVLAISPDDDVPHALMGLCQALLGNYQAAIAAYQRALDHAPRTPWYHHNLGHLLDVALELPESALSHLELAHQIEPDHDEIAASYAHCLARVGQLDGALTLARIAFQLAPRNRDHARLVSWIERGAPPTEKASGGARATQPQRSRRNVPKSEAVVEALERGMVESGYSADQVDRARHLWSDYAEGRHVRVRKPEAFAAALEYAMALILRRRGVTQAKVARRYGIAPGTLSSRYHAIRDALALEPGDPRYALLD